MRIIVAFMAAGIATASSATTSPDERLAELTRGRVAGEPVACIQPEGSIQPEIIGYHTIAFRDVSTLYIARPAGACLDLAPGRRLTTSTINGRLCHHDAFTAAVPGVPNSRFCTFGSFTPYRKVK